MPAALLSPKSAAKANLLLPPAIDTSANQVITQPIETHAYSLGQIVYQTDGPIVGLHLINQSNNQTSRQAICVTSRHSLTLLSSQYFNALQTINQSILPSTISCCFYALNNQSINQTGNQSNNPIILGHDDGSITCLDPINLSIKQSKKCHASSVTMITSTNQSVSLPNNQYVYSVDSSQTKLIVSSITTLDQVDTYDETVGLIDCLVAEAGIVWIGTSDGAIKRLTLPARAITHIIKPADIPIKQPVNQLLNQTNNPTSNNQVINQAMKYGPIRCLYASASPPPVAKKAKKKKGEEESINQSNQSTDPTIILWSSHGFASLTAWDTRTINPSNNQSVNQSMIVHQQRLTFDAIAAVQHSYNQLAINQSINQSMNQMKPFSPSNQPSTRSNAQSLLTQPRSINQSSNQIINCMLVHDGVLYTGQEDGIMGVISLSNQSNNQSNEQTIIASARPSSAKPTARPSSAQSTAPAAAPPATNQIPRRQLVEVDVEGNDSIQHMIIVTNNEEQSNNQSINQSTDQTTDQSDKDSLMEETTNDDEHDSNQSINQPDTKVEDSVPNQPISQPTNPFCAPPYILFATVAGQVHVVPIRALQNQVSSQARAMAELEQAGREEWSQAKAAKASKTARGDKKKK